MHLTCAYGYMCEVTNRDEDEIDPEDLDWLYTNTGIDGNNVSQRGDPKITIDADYSDVNSTPCSNQIWLEQLIPFVQFQRAHICRKVAARTQRLDARVSSDANFV